MTRQQRQQKDFFDLFCNSSRVQFAGPKLVKTDRISNWATSNWVVSWAVVVVSLLTFYNPAEAFSFFSNIVFEKNEIKQKRGWPTFFKIKNNGWFIQIFCLP